MAATQKPSVYSITCKVSGKKYIGGATYPAQRWYEHKSALRTGKHRNHELQMDWNYYGEHEFSFDVIEETTKENLSLREDFHINHTAKKYNILSGFNGRHYGVSSSSVKDIHRKATSKRQVQLEARAKELGFDGASAMLTAIIKREADVIKRQPARAEIKQGD